MGTEERRGIVGEIRAFDDEKRQFTARVVNYNVVDSYGSVWAPGVFKRSLEKKMPKVTWGHDWLDPIGVVIGHDERADGLDVTVQLDDFDAVPRARQAYAQLKSGSMDEFSFGFKRNQDGWTEKREDLEPYGPSARELMIDCRMDEISPVLVGAVPGTHLISTRSDSTAEIRQALELIKNGLTDEQARTLIESLTGTRAVVSLDGDETQTGAMIALLPDPATTEFINGLMGRGSLKAADLHLTICYLGDAADIADDQRTQVTGAVTSWAAETAPLTAQTGGTAYLGDDAARVLLVESDALTAAVCDLLDIAPPAVHHPSYIPHVTLSAIGTLPQPPEPTALVFDRVLVAYGPTRTVIDLVGSEELDGDDLESDIAEALGLAYGGW